MLGLARQSGAVARQPVLPQLTSRWRAKDVDTSSSCAVLCQARRARGAGGSGRITLVRDTAFRLLPFPAPPSSGGCSRNHRKGRGALSCTAALGFDVTPTTVVVLSSVLGFAALRAYIYFRIEYIIAAMVGRHVPRGGARVVELNIREGRNLYYYPSDIEQVVAVSSKSNKELLEKQAVRAGVPIQINTRNQNALGLPTSSMDAVVSVFCLCEIPDKEIAGVLREAIRVLKPGKPFIFVETIGAKNAVIQSVQSCIDGFLSMVGSARPVRRDLLPYIRDMQDFEDVESDELFNLVDPHVVGIARKKLFVTTDPSNERKKGFKKSEA